MHLFNNCFIQGVREAGGSFSHTICFYMPRTFCCQSYPKLAVLYFIIPFLINFIIKNGIFGRFLDKRLKLLIVYYMENIETAILLMVVGMATVFVILLIVIYLGKLLITLVNKYAPEEVAPAKQETPRGPAPIPGNILAAITAAVNVVTQGKGKVTKVEKL